MRTYEPRQGRKAATVVCSASAVVTLAFFLVPGRLKKPAGRGFAAGWNARGRGKRKVAPSAVSYQVIARKYRPQRFEEVVGQEHVVRALANAVKQNRIAHAYIFCGPRGTGKTTLARIFAKCLNCADGPRVDFQDDDPRCREIAEGRSLDVLEIDGASNNGVEQVRELRETVRFAPANSRFKIYIIDEVHMLTAAAFNALLKTLEEPPAHVKFLFATTDPEKVLPTILSRCQRFDLRRIPTRLIAERLEAIAEKEGVRIDRGAALAVARASEGCLRDAQSVLDQLISFCGEHIHEEDVLAMLGLASRDQIIRLADSVLRGDRGGVLRQLDALEIEGKEPGRILSELLNHLHRLLLFQLREGDTEGMDLTESEEEALARQSKLVSYEALLRMTETLVQSESKARTAVSRRVAVEVALLRASELRDAIPLEAALRELRKLREGQTPPSRSAPPAQSAPVPPEAKPAAAGNAPEKKSPLASQAATSQGTTLRETPPEPSEPARASAPVPPPAKDAPPESAPAASEEPLARVWEAFLARLEKERVRTRRYLKNAVPLRLEGRRLTAAIQGREAEKTLTLLKDARTQAALNRRLAALDMGPTEIAFELAPRGGNREQEPASGAGAPPNNAARPARSAPSGGGKLDPETFRDDPLIREALRIFEGKLAKRVEAKNSPSEASS